MAGRNFKLVCYDQKAQFTVCGDPVAKQSFKLDRSRRFGYTPERVQAWQWQVKAAALEAAGAGWAMCYGPVAVMLCFRLRTWRRADVDNLSKCVLDALKGALFQDDDQVCFLAASKSGGHGEQAGVDVALRAVVLNEHGASGFQGFPRVIFGGDDE